MSYFVETRWGGSEDSPSPARMREILDELATNDPEHPDTWLSDESGYTLTVYETGLVVLHHFDWSSERHLLEVPRERALELWLLVVDGKHDELEALPWKPGLPPPDAEALARDRAETEGALLKADRQWFDALGEESASERCAAPRCRRGRIALSVHCRVHHFESVKGRRCLF